MKSLLAFGTLAISLGQLINYLVTKARFGNLPVVEGVVTRSKLDNYNDVNGKRVYSANLNFAYYLNDEQYESNTVALRSYELFPSLDFEHQLISKYPEGAAVKVRYLPEKPNKAYLEVAPLSKFSSAALVLASLIAIGYLVLLNN